MLGITTNLEKDDLSKGIPKRRPARQKKTADIFFRLGKRAANLDVRGASLDAREQILNLYETLTMTQLRKMVTELAADAGKKLADAEVSNYKVEKLLALSGGGMPPGMGGGIPPGMPPGMGGGIPPQLPIEGGPEGAPPQLPVEGGPGGGGAPPELAPPDAGAPVIGGPPGMPPM